MSDRIFNLALTFWGVRGSIATPHPDYLHWGGNTPCIEIRGPNDELLIFDAGTGIRLLGMHLSPIVESTSLKIFLTHYHWDHTQGLPFFLPLYNPGNMVEFCAADKVASLERALVEQMSIPHFPLGFENLPAQTRFRELEGPIVVGEVTVTPFPLNHPQGANGYRIESRGKVVVYASDHEHGDPETDRHLCEMSEGADVLIYDAHYTPEDYESKVGWGHSTWLAGTEVANAASVGRLALFHHNPDYTDVTLEGICHQARKHFDNTILARERVPIIL